MKIIFGFVISFLSTSIDGSERGQKLLNVFTIVNFPNAGCNTTDNTYGTCYTASECTALGGSNSGTCASGFGVCCAFTGSCGGTTKLNNTYFSSTGSDTSPCKFSVCKCSSDICQIRLGFDTFSIDQPDQTTSTENFQPRTQCLLSQFTATSFGSNSPNTICGTNTGYHMYLEASDNCNPLEFMWTSSSSKSWKIHIMQIPCDATWKPPAGCTQYFTGTTGTINSYNFQAGTSHIANMNYQNCIRTEAGRCSITYAAPTFSVGSSNAATSLTATSCSYDYILIPQGAATTTAQAAVSRFCGAFLNPTTAIGASANVLTQVQPFTVGVVFDAVEVTGETATTGFQLTYTQSTTC